MKAGKLGVAAKLVGGAMSTMEKRHISAGKVGAKPAAAQPANLKADACVGKELKNWATGPFRKIVAGILNTLKGLGRGDAVLALDEVIVKNREQQRGKPVCWRRFLVDGEYTPSTSSRARKQSRAR